MRAFSGECDGPESLATGHRERLAASFVLETASYMRLNESTG